MRILEWKRVAVDDLLAIVDYISDENPDAAERLREKVEMCAMNLLNQPKLYKHGRVEGTREMVVHRNFVLVYAEDEERVVILRFLHTARQWPQE